MRTTIIILILVFVLSLIAVIASKPDTLLSTLAQYPAICALLGILWKIVQDEISFQKDLRKAEMEAMSTLFAGGHYASEIYDKHIDFCETYWKRTLDIVKELHEKGQFPEVLDRANDLYRYRMESAIWLTEEMNIGLEGFEKALRSMGAASTMLNHVPVGDERTAMVEKIYDNFKRVLSVGGEASDSATGISYIDVLKELQKILGIAQAYDFRRRFLDNSRQH